MKWDGYGASRRKPVPCRGNLGLANIDSGGSAVIAVN